MILHNRGLLFLSCTLSVSSDVSFLAQTPKANSILLCEAIMNAISVQKNDRQDLNDLNSICSLKICVEIFACFIYQRCK